MWSGCGGPCNCRYTAVQEFVEDQGEEDPTEEPVTHWKLGGGDAVEKSGHKAETSLVQLPGCSEELLKAAIVNEAPLFPLPQGERAFTPLEEDKPIFQLDAERLMVAKSHLISFRKSVDKELALVASLQDVHVLEAETHFCSDATLLRYLCTNDGNEKKAMSMLRDTLKWRRKYFPVTPGKALSVPVCPGCTADPNSHCFLNLGKDAAGRILVYSCAGRAANKVVQDGMRHMACELERIFDGNSSPGQITWIVDFAGFGLVDCNPRMAATAVPMFACHYPERFGQIVLFAMPTIFRAIYSATMKLVDPVMQRKVVILHTAEARRRYSECYWSCNPPMAAWIEAVITCKGVPGSYPHIDMSHALGQKETCDLLERCARGAKLSNR